MDKRDELRLQLTRSAKEHPAWALGILIMLLSGNVLLYYLSPWYGLAFTFTLVFVIWMSIYLLLKAYELAEQDKLFTFVREGTAKVIMRGAEFDRAIMVFDNFHLNDPKASYFDPTLPEWHVVYHGRKTDAGGVYTPGTENDILHTDSFYDLRPWYLKLAGLHWVGLPPVSSVYRYQFKWTELQTALGGKQILVSRDDETNFIFISDFTYGLYSGEAQTVDGVTVEIVHLDTLAVRNPRLALFSGEDWMLRVGAVTGREARNHIGKRTFAQLRSETDQKDLVLQEEDSFSLPIVRLSHRLPDETLPPFGLELRYGVLIRSADTFELQYEGSDRLKAAFTAGLVAKEEAGAARLEAEGKADAERIRGKAEADVTIMTARANARELLMQLRVMRTDPETSRLLAQLNALAETSKGPGTTMVWAQNPLIKSDDPVATLLASAGVKTLSDLKEYLKDK